MVRRAVELGDGFNGGMLPMAAVAQLVQEIREAASARHKDPDLLHIVCRGNYRVHDTPQGKDRRPLWGTPDEIREYIGRYDSVYRDLRRVLGHALQLAEQAGREQDRLRREALIRECMQVWRIVHQLKLMAYPQRGLSLSRPRIDGCPATS